MEQLLLIKVWVLLFAIAAAVTRKDVTLGLLLGLVFAVLHRYDPQHAAVQSAIPAGLALGTLCHLVRSRRPLPRAQLVKGEPR
jgi:mannose/fructose/N-acetylgalactosamine-specific phosphotransferase system component IIC